PPLIRSAMGLGLAEINLRSGKPVIADKFMGMAEKDYPYLPPHLRGNLIYLQGEKARQEGSNELTEKSWLRLARGEDDLFRVKGSLALTRFLVDQGKMPPRQAIDKLEGLRYAWRGDDLEANVNYWLGRTYFENNDYIKGLNIMRDASTYASHSGLAEKITNDMSQLYIDLFTGDKLKDVPPEDAVNLYEQFRELSPPDDRGDKIVERLAEHLANAGLVGRAGDLMKNQVDHRLKGYDAFRIATRLAALRLLDDKPDDAMDAIKKAESILGELPEEQKTDKNARMVELLKARSYSGKGNADRALELLRDMELSPDLNRLKAEIAWKASYWDDAAEALHDVILDQNLSLTRPLEDDQAALLIQRAVALNLGGDRVALANMRERYSDAMAQTEQAKIFEIITRPRQSITLADRETLLSVVSEIELFDGILQAIRAGEDADLEASTTNSVEDNVDPEQDTAAETAQ
ncbi:MAG: hypothetical protein KTR28_05440, partial [Micavibrio sp.]|nr:hypothetical protein [Micavibrio sp.]